MQATDTIGFIVPPICNSPGKVIIRIIKILPIWKSLNLHSLSTLYSQPSILKKHLMLRLWYSFCIKSFQRILKHMHLSSTYRIRHMCFSFIFLKLLLQNYFIDSMMLSARASIESPSSSFMLEFTDMSLSNTFISFISSKSSRINLSV